MFASFQEKQFNIWKVIVACYVLDGPENNFEFVACVLQGEVVAESSETMIAQNLWIIISFHAFQCT